MRKFILTGIIGLSLSACATTGPAAYGPASNGGGLGFENTKIESDRFRISYTARTDAEAQDFALRRAAEITLDEGFSHFAIINGGRSNNGPNPGVSTAIGIGFGSGYRGRSRSNVNIGASVYDIARALEGSKITETIEVKLLRSAGQDPNVYDAKSVTESIQPAVFQ